MDHTLLSIYGSRVTSNSISVSRTTIVTICSSSNRTDLAVDIQSKNLLQFLY